MNAAANCSLFKALHPHEVGTLSNFVTDFKIKAFYVAPQAAAELRCVCAATMGFSLNFILISSRCHLSGAKLSNIQETPDTAQQSKGVPSFCQFSQNCQFPKTCKNAPAQSESWTKGTHWRVPKNPKSLDVEAAAVHSTQHWSWKLLDVKFLWELSEISVFRFILTIYIFLLVLWQNKWRKTFITH